MSVGQALFEGGVPDRRPEQGFYGDRRLSMLLNARGDAERVQWDRVFLIMKRSGVTFNWRQMSRLIFSPDQTAADLARQAMSEQYRRSAHRFRAAAGESSRITA